MGLGGTWTVSLPEKCRPGSWPGNSASGMMDASWGSEARLDLVERRIRRLFEVVRWATRNARDLAGC